jgi:hypothetical protein
LHQLKNRTFFAFFQLTIAKRFGIVSVENKTRPIPGRKE